MSDTGDPTLDQLIQAIASAGGAGATVAPIGVPEGYAAPAERRLIGVGPELPPGVFGPGGFVDTPIPPRYFEGDEITPAGLSAEDIARLQRRMYGAGLFSETEAQTVRLGIWDAASVNAYTRLLGFANQTGLDDQAALAEYRERGETYGQLPGGGTLTANPADIRAVADAAALRVRGRKLDEQEMSAFQRAYHSTVEQPGLGVAAPDPNVFATEQVEQMDPAGAVDYRILQAQDEWNQAIASPVGG